MQNRPNEQRRSFGLFFMPFCPHNREDMRGETRLHLCSILKRLFLSVLPLHRFMCGRQTAVFVYPVRTERPQAQEWDQAVGMNRRQSKEVIVTADTEFSLLYYLADQAGCTRLSDLSALGCEARTRLALALEGVPADRTGLREWNAALTYLTGAPLRLNAEAAREDLIALLRSGAKGGDSE